LSPAAYPFPGARDRQSLISWRWSLQSQFGEDRCTQFRVIVVTDPQTQPRTHKQTGPITIQCKSRHRLTSGSRASPYYVTGSLRRNQKGGIPGLWLLDKDCLWFCIRGISIRACINNVLLLNWGVGT